MDDTQAVGRAADPLLRIALLAHLRHPIRTPFMGGMEAHTFHLARELARRGHEVTLFASGDSDVEAGPRTVRLHPLLPRAYEAHLPWHTWRETPTLTRLLDDAHAAFCTELARGDFDVVHNSGLHRFPPRYARVARQPMLTVLHVPPFDVLHRAVHDSPARWVRFASLSGAQHRVWWPDGAPDGASIIPNGIDLDAWPFSPKGDGSAVWFGRLTELKGAHLAMDTADRLGVPLTLYGTREDRTYFDAAIRPRLTRRIRYGGHLSQPELAREIGRSSAALVTPIWDEPFGLTAIEAMACGVPVAAISRGDLPRIVGTTGAIARTCDLAALSEALKTAMTRSRRGARARVEERYALGQMVNNYEAQYRIAIASRGSGPTNVEFPAHKLAYAEPDRRDGTYAATVDHSGNASSTWNKRRARPFSPQSRSPIA